MRFRTSGAPVPVIPEAVRTYRRTHPLAGKYPGSGPSVAGNRAGRSAARTLGVNPAVDNAIRPLVLLIDFADRPASPTVASKALFDTLFFGAGVSDLSVKNYWNEVSYGQFAVNGSAADINPGTATPTGWLRAGVDFPTTIASIDNIVDVQVGNIRTLIADAVSFLAGQGVDFSPYVSSSTGEFFAVILVHPTYGQEDSGGVGLDPYSHTAGIAPIITAAGNIVDYTIVPSLQYYSDPTPRGSTADDPPIGVGVIVHEMGHLLGLPDLYPTALFGQIVPTFSGAGVFDLMAYGMWGSNLLLRADVPAHLSAWSKMTLGWATPTLVTAATPRTLRPAELFPDIDKVYSNTGADPGQFFLVENREVASTLGNFLFDRFLPGAGILVWQIDDNVVQANLATNTVNSDNVYRGVYVEEADGVADTAKAITGTTANDRARFFGQVTDYFTTSGQLFGRTDPSTEVNSSPVIDNVFHPFDFGEQVEMLLFNRTATNSVDYLVSISGGGGAASWKTFNINSTQPPKFPAPMRSNDILSIAFDSGNNVWMGSSDQGIFRFLGTEFEFLTTLRGLPSGSGTPVAPIRAMAFESSTGSMWVGTDQGLYKMRDSGTGFRVQASFTTASPVPRTLPGSNLVQAIAVRDGTDIKYVGNPSGLVRIVDGLTDGQADDFASLVFAGDVTAVAIDDNGNADISDDVVWVGTAAGTLYRSLLPTEGGPADNDPVLPAHFKTYSLASSPRITSLGVDKVGRLWIGTDSRGVQVFDLGEPQSLPNLRDPFDFDIDGDLNAEAYLNRTRGTASDNVTGISFQVSLDNDAIAWISHVRDGVNPGGASRFVASGFNDNLTVLDERVTVFRPEAGVPPEDQVNGPASTGLSTVAGDSAGNVWVGTTGQVVASEAQGVSRFGNAGVLSLDKSNYVNVTAIATITLQDDGLNIDAGIADLAIVRVTSTTDPVGFFLVLVETGVDTGIFQGTFGFTNGASDGLSVPPVLHVAHQNTVTVTYADANPPGLRTATATWKRVFPFEDTLLIEGGACFIATAAYGSILAPEVRTLREFRDRWLLPNRPGRRFVALYYRYSPPVASVIAGSPALRCGVRFLLAPVAWFAGFFAAIRPAEMLLSGTIVLMVPMLAGIASLRKRKRGRNPSTGEPARVRD
ncbi:MAG: hypothetical protein Kow00128_07640 [Deltaproteobacteria bacterium]